MLDVACGHGRLTRELARIGARRPTIGVDSSAALLSPAEQAEQDRPLGIRYLHADVTAQDWLGENETRFDAVTCHYGLSDIDYLDGALRGVSAALRPGGRFVFSILHPCFPGGDDVSGSCRQPEAITTKGSGPPTAPCPRCVARSALTTACSVPT